MCHAARALGFLTLGFSLLGCQKAKVPVTEAVNTTTPEAVTLSTPEAAVLAATLEKPAPALVLPEPPPESADLYGQNIEQALPSELARLAKDFAAGGNLTLALRCQYWYARQTNDGHFDLARYYAQSGAVEPAFYWLQVAARNEGVDASVIPQNVQWESVARDPRWPMVQQFLRHCAQVWEAQNKPVTTLILPRGYARERRPVWVVVWLHGMGANPQNFVDPDDEESLCQTFADTLNVAFVGVSGTLSRGKNSYVWAENPARDLERVQAALASVADRLSVRPAGLIAFGFSQGGQVGVELAARHPELFAGAIALSPGSKAVHLSEITTPNPLLKDRAFVLGCGDGEASGTRNLTAENGKWAEAAGAKVKIEFFREQSRHDFPTDFAKAFPLWVRFVQATSPPAKN